MQTNAGYWFAAKRYGWGWGRPIAWQGWVVVAAFIALFAAGLLLLPPGRQPGAFLAYIAVLSAALIGVCYLKGEPLRWRWGNDK